MMVSLNGSDIHRISVYDPSQPFNFCPPCHGLETNLSEQLDVIYTSNFNVMSLPEPLQLAKEGKNEILSE